MTIALKPEEPSVEDLLTPRQRRRQAMLERAIGTAFDIVSESGLPELTLKRVSERLDYTETALYRYFPNKAALIAAMARETVRMLHDELREQARAHADEPLVVMWAAALLYADLAESRPAHFSLLSQTFGDPRQLVDEASAGETLAALRALIADLGQVLSAATERGALDSREAVRERALALWSGVHGAMLLRKLERFESSSVRAAPVVRGMVRSLLMGWGGDAEQVAAAEEAGRAALEGLRANREDFG